MVDRLEAIQVRGLLRLNTLVHNNHLIFMLSGKKRESKRNKCIETLVGCCGWLIWKHCCAIHFFILSYTGITCLIIPQNHIWINVTRKSWCYTAMQKKFVVTLLLSIKGAIEQMNLLRIWVSLCRMHIGRWRQHWLRQRAWSALIQTKYAQPSSIPSYTLFV